MKVKVRFKEQVEKGEGGKERRFRHERVEVSNGDYRRVFERKGEPFQVKSEEWEVLRATGLFEEVEERQPPPPPPNGQLQAGAPSGEQQQ